MINEKQLSNDRKLLNEKNQVIAERELFTDKEASEYLRVSQVTLWRERKKGKIDFRRVASKIVYLREDLEKYLTRNKRNAFSIQD
ncbi:MAG: helix-turn-helix domain-containing protein [Acidobacteriota bacterium]